MSSESRASLLAGLRLAIGLTVALRIVLALVGLAAGAVEVIKGPIWRELVVTGGEPSIRLVSMWQRWDALWYEHIARTGYQPGNGTTAFFPLYPSSVSLATPLLGGNVVWAELVVSSLAFVAAMTLLYVLVRHELARGGVRGPRPLSGEMIRSAPALTVLAVALFPTGFFLLAPYTEALFLALAVAALLLSRMGRPWAAGVAGFFAALTRAQGVLLAIPLVYEQLRGAGVFGRAARRPRGLSASGLISSLMPLIGTLVVTVYYSQDVREKLTPVQVQAMWGFEWAWPWETITASIQHIARGGEHGNEPAIEALNLVALFGFAALAILVTRWWPRAYALYAWGSVALLFSGQRFFSPLMSVDRFALVIFPCFMVGATLLARNVIAATLVLVASAAGMLWLFYFWVGWGFVG